MRLECGYDPLQRCHGRRLRTATVKGQASKKPDQRRLYVQVYFLFAVPWHVPSECGLAAKRIIGCVLLHTWLLSWIFKYSLNRVFFRSAPDRINRCAPVSREHFGPGYISGLVEALRGHLQTEKRRVSTTSGLDPRSAIAAGGSASEHPRAK